jgi:uncharacterized protein DUF6174
MLERLWPTPRPARPWHALLPCVLFLASCGGIDGPDDRYAEANENLSRARGRWNAAHITSYDYVIQRLCFCPTETLGPVRVSVRNNALVGMVYTANDQPVPAQYIGSFPPVDVFFNLIADAIGRRASSINVTYDVTRSFPTRVAIDYVANAVDDELTVEAKDFVVK